MPINKIFKGEEWIYWDIKSSWFNLLWKLVKYIVLNVKVSHASGFMFEGKTVVLF